MLTAKLFTCEGGQAVELPKEIHFDGDEVIINKVGNIVMLMPKNDQWAGFEYGITMFTSDFMSEGRTT